RIWEVPAVDVTSETVVVLGERATRLGLLVRERVRLDRNGECSISHCRYTSCRTNANSHHPISSADRVLPHHVIAAALPAKNRAVVALAHELHQPDREPGSRERLAIAGKPHEASL